LPRRFYLDRISSLVIELIRANPDSDFSYGGLWTATWVEATSMPHRMNLVSH